MTVGITGASGFLGGYLASAFARDGADVVAFVRDPARQAALPRCVARAYELGSVPNLEGVDTLVHCAFATGASADHDVVSRNIEGTVALFAAARTHGIRIAFVSSMSAASAVRSAYAQQKRAIEAELRGDELALRPGLIAGGGGLFARLRALASRPLVPLIGGGRQNVQLVAVEDVYAALRVSLGARLSGAHNVVAEPPLQLRDVLTRLSARASGPRFLEVPLPLAFGAAALAERLGLSLPVTTENLRGLRDVAVHPASECLRTLGWQPQNAAAVLDRFASNARA